MAGTIGVVGPSDSVSRILEVAREFPGLTLKPYAYEHTQEVLSILNNHPEIEFWLFSGRVPYAYAREHGAISPENALYVSIHGSSLIRTLLQANLLYGYDLKRISFDTFREEEIDEVFRELGLQLEHKEMLAYSGYMQSERLEAFHREALQSGKVDLAITCMRSVYNRLREEGWPILRVLPTRMIIRQTLNYLQQKMEAAYYLESSIAVITLSFSLPQSGLEESYSYKIKQQLLQCEENILAYAEHLNGSMFRIGDTAYVIFTTRGALQTSQSTYPIEVWIRELSHLTRFSANAGIGFGHTVFEAERNSRLALRYSREHGEMSIFRVNEKGEIEGPLSGESISYSQRQVDEEEWPIHWTRVRAYLRRHGTNEVTAHQLACWMHVTDRNARRILTELEEAGLAEVIGEEQPGPKGRPRKVYRVRMETGEDQSKSNCSQDKSCSTELHGKRI